jgi:hypothetical protein
MPWFRMLNFRLCRRDRVLFCCRATNQLSRAHVARQLATRLPPPPRFRLPSVLIPGFHLRVRQLQLRRQLHSVLHA